MKKKDREVFLKQIFWEVVGSAFIAAGIYNFAVQAGFPDDRIFRYFDHFISAVRCADRIFHDTAEYTGGNIMLSSAGKTFFLQLTALYADFFSDD